MGCYRLHCSHDPRTASNPLPNKASRVALCRSFIRCIFPRTEPHRAGQSPPHPPQSGTVDPSTRSVWQLAEHLFEPRSVLVANDYSLLCQRAVAGQVLTELPPFLAKKEISAGRLRAVLPGCAMPEQMLHLIYPSQRHPSSIFRAYLDFCQQHVHTYLDGA